MPNLNTYQRLEKELPAILMVVLVILAFIVVFIRVAILRRCWRKNKKGSSENGDTSGTSGSSNKTGSEDKARGKGDTSGTSGPSNNTGSEDKNDMKAPLWFIEIIKLYIPHIEAKEDGIHVFHQKIKRGCVDVLIVILIPIMVGIMFITFCNVYLVEESVRGDCEANFDCFPKTGGHFHQNEPVDNCSVFESNSNVTYECYRLVFNYAEGLGAAGGILIFTAVLSKLYISLLVTTYKCKKDNKCCRFTLYAIVWALALIILVLFVTVSIRVSMLKETILKTVTDRIQFAMYALSLLVIIVSGMVVAVGIEIENK